MMNHFNVVFGLVGFFFMFLVSVMPSYAATVPNLRPPLASMPQQTGQLWTGNDAWSSRFPSAAMNQFITQSTGTYGIYLPRSHPIPQQKINR
jgi:hypothetical protein